MHLIVCYNPLWPKGCGKIMLMMKLTAFLLLAGSLTAHADSHAQVVSIFEKNVPLTKIFRAIEKQTGYTFVYRKVLVQHAKKVTVSLREAPLAQVLDACFQGQPLSYSVLNNIIVIKEKKAVVRNDELPFESIAVRGRVENEKGEPLGSATITEKGTQNSVKTNDDGSFSINVGSTAPILIASFVGYETKEVTVAGQTYLTISLTSLEQQMSDVVVVGYGTQSQRRVTGAIASINEKDIGAVAVTGLDQAIQGRIAGVQVTQNSGEPGGSVSVKIRGVGSLNSSTEPLYVVDGIPLPGGLNVINPNDIERIDVLKDASAAAIYGSRATNGVVLVTTKSGKAGSLRINVDAYTGIQSTAKKISLLNGPQFARLANENLSNSGYATNPAWTNPESLPTYDWQDAVFRTSSIQNYSVSMGGGGERSRSFLSLGYFQNGGIIIGSGYERYTANFKSDYNLSKRIKVGAIANLAYEKKQTVYTDQSFAGILSNASQLQPTTPIYTDQEGLWNDNNYFGWNGYNFIAKTANTQFYASNINNEVYTYAKDHIRMPSSNFDLQTAAFAEVKLIEGLKFRTTMNLSTGTSLSQTMVKEAPREIDHVGQYIALSNYSEGWYRYNQWNWINTLNYLKAIGKHTFEAMAGTDALKNNSRYLSVNGTGNADGQNSINATDNIAKRNASGQPADFSLFSYFGRLTYDYDGKYLLAANFRRDGSSKFGPNKKYGNFPSASIGWRITEENFMRSVSFINELKLRASYGLVGNQNIPNFQYLTTYSTQAGRYEYIIGTDQRQVPAIYPDKVGDPNIHWEKSSQFDVGLDAALFGQKLMFTADYYSKKLNDLLGASPLPSYVGINGNFELVNGFSMLNKGFEFSLAYHNNIGQLTYSVNGNFSTLNNKVTRLTGDEKSYVSYSISFGGVDGGASTRSQIGERIANFWGYITDGIYQNDQEVSKGGLGGVSPGDRRYKDVDGNNQINPDDRTIIGNGLPRYTFGFSLNMEYKRFDVTVFLNGQAGAQIANLTRAYLYNLHFFGGPGLANGSTDLLNSWHGEGTGNTMPRNAYDAPASNRWFSSYYIEDGAFVRVRNLQLGYTFPSAWFSKLGLSKGRLYLSAQNLYTFTKYSGYDPEVGSSSVNRTTSQNPLTTGVDFGRYPTPRTFMVGINFQF